MIPGQTQFICRCAPEWNSMTFSVVYSNVSSGPLQLFESPFRSVFQLPPFNEKSVILNFSRRLLTVGRKPTIPLNSGPYLFGVHNPIGGTTICYCRLLEQLLTLTGIIPIVPVSPATNGSRTMRWRVPPSTDQRPDHRQRGSWGADQHPRISDLALTLVSPAAPACCSWKNGGGPSPTGAGRPLTAQPTSLPKLHRAIKLEFQRHDTGV